MNVGQPELQQQQPAAAPSPRPGCRAWLRRYLLAPLTIVGAFLGRLSLDPVLGEEHQPFATFYIAVGLTAWFGGLGPTLLSIVLGLLISLYAIIPPRDSFILTSHRDVAEVTLFMFYAGITAAIVLLLRVLRAARLELAATNAGLEQRVQQRTNQLRELVAELERFSYSMVHDLRGPLRAMEGYALLLERKLTALPRGMELIEFAKRIRMAAQRMDQLITDALSYSKAVRSELVLQPVDLDALLRSLVQTYPNLQGHEQSIHLAPALPVVLGNEAALTQCFGNLLDNALKFVAPGRPPRVQVWADVKDGWARVSVQDNGVGIPREGQARLFHMFERLHHDYEGTGIGLALVRKVVERMGGKVGVDSTPGEGSRFWVELRAAS